MADFASIELTFNADLIAGEGISFGIGFGQEIIETWYDARTASNQVAVGIPVGGSDGERSAINFMNAVKLDYALYPFTVTRLVNVVTIVSNDPLFQFTWTGDAPAGVDHVIDNTTEALLTIDDVLIEEATTGDPATHIKVTITTSIDIKKLNSPHEQDDINADTYVFEIERDTEFIIEVESAGGQVASQKVEKISSLNEATLSFSSVYSPEGTTLTVGFEGSGLDLEYSLNNVDWFSENVFAGLDVGSYTVYVRDSLGVTTSKDVEIGADGINIPYVYIPRTNSIRFANRITFGDSSNYKTDENTLSCEADVPYPHRAVQPFQTGDIITTQFRSNYGSVYAQVHKADGTFDNITVVKKSNNIGLKDRRDARRYGIYPGKTGIYFTSGNLYNYVTGVDIGDYYLNGALPIWGVKGNYLKLSGAWYLIQDVVFDETKNAEMLVINLNSQVGSDVAVQVQCEYNLANFEIYEFVIDMATYIDQRISVKILNLHTFFEDVIHESEVIEVKVRHLNTVEIAYWNKHNTDIDFSTGIRNKIRTKLEKVSGRPRSESEIYITDTDALLLSAEMHERDEFEFQPVTKQFMWLICMALSHSSVQLDGVDYVRDGDFDIEGPLEETNLYIVKASMLKARDAYRSDSGVGEFSLVDIEVPALVGGGNDFVKYQ